MFDNFGLNIGKAIGLVVYDFLVGSILSSAIVDILADIFGPDNVYIILFIYRFIFAWGWIHIISPMLYPAETSYIGMTWQTVKMTLFYGVTNMILLQAGAGSQFIPSVITAFLWVGVLDSGNRLRDVYNNLGL